ESGAELTSRGTGYQPVTPGQWNKVQFTDTVPDGAADARLVLNIRNESNANVSAGAVVYMDEHWLGPDASYFDGDTEDGATDNESHYRWTCEPHASPSEKYLPALDIGESDNWNVIEQYRHDGTGWVRVELSHRVFSTVDLGKATVGELDGVRIMGQSIH